MRSDENYNDRNQPIEKIKEKSADFRDGLSLAIREEKMRIRRDDLQKHMGAHSQHSAPLKSEQRRGGQNG
jgi:hypothetical protein